MILKYKNKIAKYLFVVTAGIAFTGCVNKDEFFELKDRSGIDAAIWSTEGAVNMHLRETYDMAVPRFPHQESYDRYSIHLASDENYFSGEDNWARTALGLQGELMSNDVRFVGNKYQGNNFGDNRYFDIARCNNAIEFIPSGTMAPDLKKRFMGQYYALRSLIYFELVKVYGGVPLVLEPQSPGGINVGGRESAEVCFKQIVSDLDSAIVNLKGITWGGETGRISEEIATCLKARVLLFAASPQFNPRNDPEHPFDPEKWNTALAANEAAYNLCVTNGRKLMDNYIDIFRVEGSANTEAIFVRSYSNSLDRRGHNTETRVRPKSVGGSPSNAFIPSTILLDAYPMKDGSSINESGKYNYDNVLFWQNRDPRFTASYAYNGSIYEFSGEEDDRQQWTYANAAAETGNWAVYNKRFASPSLSKGAVSYSNNLGGSGMDWIELRFAEVLLNYAECLNETGQTELAKDLVRDLRIKRGLEEGLAGNDYGLDAGTDRVSMGNLITKERQIEFAFENKRNADLRRLRKWHTLSGTIETPIIEFQKPSDNTRNEKWLQGIDPNTGKPRRDTLDINNKSTYLYYFKPGTKKPGGNGTFTIPEFHYFYTFHNDFINSSALLQPTIGWAGGTFDPLD